MLIMANGFYRWYLTTEHWKTFRLHALEEHGKICKDCGATDTSLHVHHLTYENLWEETLDDVVILCHSCHWARHPEKKTSKCSHGNRGKSWWESGGTVKFCWSCVECVPFVFLGWREPDEKEIKHAERVAAKHVIWLEKETIKRSAKEARDKETQARRKEREKLKPKPKSKKLKPRRKPYKKRVKVTV